MGETGEAGVPIALVRDGAEREERSDAFAFVTDFVMGALSPSERMAFERRLETDSEFRQMAMPLITGWRYGEAVTELSVAPTEVAWLDLCQRVDAVGHPFSGESDASGLARRVIPVPWYRVAPPWWIVRMGLTAAALVGGAAWLIAFLVRHRWP